MVAKYAMHNEKYCSFGTLSIECQKVGNYEIGGKDNIMHVLNGENAGDGFIGQNITVAKPLVNKLRQVQHHRA